MPVSFYQRPGFRPLANGIKAPVRGIWHNSFGGAYCVIGERVYSIDQHFVLTQIGTVTPGRTNPCSFVDNGYGGGQGFLVDGSPNGWQIDLNTNAMTQINDPTGTFIGAKKVDFMDTFFLFDVPGGYQWGISNSNSLVFDPTNLAAKTNWPDALQTLAVNRHELILFGAFKSEIWYDAGNPLFPFAELPGTVIEHGTCAPYSVATTDISTLWLGLDLQGQGVVWRFRGYQTTRISNHALEVAIRQMANAAGWPVSISDAIGYTYQQDGHYFYVLIFPTGDQTWVFDESTSEWHQRCWTDGNGLLHRDRSNCHAFIYGQNVVGDFENGTLYALDLDAYTDTVDGLEVPITCVRTFPHITKAIDPRSQQIIDWDGARVRYNAFQLDLEPGLAPGMSGNQPALVSLRWSDTRGRTWGNAVLQSSGHPGEYLTTPLWRGLGVARNRVFEISHSLAGPAALNGAFIEAEEAQS